jgi:transcriptional regulator
MNIDLQEDIGSERERQAWRLRVQGWTQERIAEHLECTQAGISKALKRIEQKLADAFVEEAREIKARQTAILEHVADEALQAWAKSKLDAEAERIVTEEVNLVNEDDEDKISVPGVKVKTTNERKGQSGEPAHLAQARGALSDIRGIWGIDAPKQTDANVNVRNLSDAELIAAAAGAFTGTGTAGADPAGEPER